MPSAHSIVGALVVGSASLLLPACGGGGGGGDAGSGSGLTGTYSSVNDDGVTVTLKSGGKMETAAAGLGSSNGTYTADGDKITVTLDNQNYLFIRDGNCIEEHRNIFGKLCKGGKAGEAANASSGNAHQAPTGTWVATNADGEFKITFAAGNRLTLSMTPTIGNPETHDGTFTIEGSNLFATVDPGTSLVLTYVNNSYESSAFGLPMKFVKR